MTKKRISTLSKLIETDTLKKQALNTGEMPDVVDQVTADNLAKKIYEQIFDEELKKIVGS